MNGIVTALAAIGAFIVVVCIVGGLCHFAEWLGDWRRLLVNYAQATKLEAEVAALKAQLALVGQGPYRDAGVVAEETAA